MNGRTIIELLRRLCRDIDEGRPLRRIRWRNAVGPAVLGVSLAASGGCSSATPETLEPPVEPAPVHVSAVEICTDGVDNDGDGSVDCEDQDCLEDVVCNPAVMEYGVPMPEEEPPPPEAEADIPPRDQPYNFDDDVVMYAAPFV